MLVCLNAELPNSCTLAFTGVALSSGGKRSASMPSIAAITPCTAAYIAIRSPPASASPRPAGVGPGMPPGAAAHSA